MTNPGFPGSTPPPPPPPNYPPPKGGMPKWLIILLVVLLVVLVGCCGGFVMCTFFVRGAAQEAGVRMREIEAQAERRLEAEAERQRAAGGGVEDRGGGAAGVMPEEKLPVNFPSDVPVYTGLTPMPNTSVADKTTGSGRVVLTGKIDKDKAVAYYEKELASRDWKQERNQDIGTTTIMTYSKENRRLTLTASPNGDSGETTVTILYQQE